MARAPKSNKPAFVVPKTLGACADALYTTRQARLAEKKGIDEYEDFEKRLKAYIIDNLPKSDLTGASGKIANAKVETKEIPVVEDWDKFYAFVKKNNRFDLLARSINSAAVNEMWDAGKKIPGIGVFNAVKVSVTKI